MCERRVARRRGVCAKRSVRVNPIAGVKRSVRVNPIFSKGPNPDPNPNQAPQILLKEASCNAYP